MGNRRITKKAFLKALRGCGGLRSEVARRLGISRVSVYRILKRAGWEDVQRAFDIEADAVVDESETTIRDLVGQRDDLGVAFAASKFVLQSKGADRGYRKEISISGGSSPIRMEAAIVNLDSFQIPLEARRQMLEAMEKPPETIEVPHLQLPHKEESIDVDFAVVEEPLYQVVAVRKRTN